MPMSKKHYDADAAAISTVLWSKKTDPLTIGLLIQALSDVREQDNPRFDRHRFFEACTKNPSTK